MCNRIGEWAFNLPLDTIHDELHASATNGDWAGLPAMGDDIIFDQGAPLKPSTTYLSLGHHGRMNSV